MRSLTIDMLSSVVPDEGVEANCLLQSTKSGELHGVSNGHKEEWCLDEKQRSMKGCPVKPIKNPER
jgi:hypothetical protein